MSSQKVSGQSKTISSSYLTVGHKYRVYVTAYSENGTYSVREYIDFNVGEAALGTFRITSPVAGSTKTGNVTVKWSASSNADHYTISIGQVGVKMVLNNEEVSGTSYTISSSLLTKGNEYRLYVIAYSASGEKKKDASNTEMTFNY